MDYKIDLLASELFRVRKMFPRSIENEIYIEYSLRSLLGDQKIIETAEYMIFVNDIELVIKDKWQYLEQEKLKKE